MKTFYIFLILLQSSMIFSKDILIEAESFNLKGGWLVDPQFVEQMGSSYLLAHGLGKPVNDAQTSFKTDKNGNYNIWVRTKNWAPGNWEAPGIFKLQVNNHVFSEILGTNTDWDWQFVGQLKLKEGINQLILKDLTGFDARCDAIFLSIKDNPPPSEALELAKWRHTVLQLPETPEQKLYFDLIITGGGIAG